MGDRPPLSERLGAGISYTIFSSAAVLCNILVYIALRRHWKVFGRYPFYTLAKNLIFASFGELLAQFIVAIPLSFTGQALYGDDTVLIVFSSFDTFFFIALFFTSLFIALNRCFAVFFPRLYILFFTDYRLHLTCASTWIISAIWVLVTTMIGCPKIFRHDGFYYTYRCDDNLTDAAENLMHVSMHLSYSIPAVMLIVYALVLWKVHSLISFGSFDTKILIQSLLICIVFEIEAILFAILPKLEHKMGLFWFSLILDYVLILTASMSSIILLFLNPRIKETVKSFFSCSKKVQQFSSYAQTNYQVYDISDEYGRNIKEEERRKSAAAVEMYARNS
uniref:G-protein coupled receptors family 1 profile domain-containing protein n=1 Tax=Panagrolaimus sp. PS1159 TaxID=55785 RepID=A0AC35FNU5_9BILA